MSESLESGIKSPFGEYCTEVLTFGGEIATGGIQAALAPDDPDQLRQDLADLRDLEENEREAITEIVVFK